MTSQDMIYLLAFIGLICCILFASVWICGAIRILWMYGNYAASKAIKAHKLAMRIRARTKAISDASGGEK